MDFIIIVALLPYTIFGFRYFLQTHECKKTDRTKVRVRKWIDTPDFDRYEKFVCDWHYYLKDLEEEIAAKADDPSFAKMVSLSVLKVFYMMPYDGAADFYGQFYSRMRQFGWNG